MRNILKGLLDPETYRFPSAEELGLEEESPPDAPGEEEGVGGDEEAGEEIQPEMSGHFPHCASTAATRSPFSLK